MAIGIFLSEKLGYSPDCLKGLSASIGLLFLTLLLFYRMKNFAQRSWFGLGVVLFFFLLGGWLWQYAWQKNGVKWPDTQKAYRGSLIDTPLEKANSYTLLVEVEGHTVMLYLPKSTASKTIDIGDELLFYTTIRTPRNAGNPDEFDYARYLFLRGVTGTAWVEEGFWQRCESQNSLTLKQQALRVRRKIVNTYDSWGVTEENLAVLSALTVGEKEDLSQETRNDYALAGLSHLLALSGLHVGIIWGCIAFLFRWLARGLGMRLIRCLLVVSALWLFAFVGGLTPSLIRAVIMCTLLEISLLRNGKVHSMHTLALAAWMMLLYNPFYLFDVGFQLSFVAVLSILLFAPHINAFLNTPYRWLRYLTQVVSVSVAAQVGTAPLTLYYFSLFPSYFLLSNLAVLFLLPFLLFGTLLALLFSFWPWLQNLLIDLVTWSVTLLNNLAQQIGSFSYAAVRIEHLSWIQVVFGYVFLGWLFLYLHNRGGIQSRKIALTFCFILVLYSGLNLIESSQREKRAEILFYNHRSLPAIHLISENKESWLITHQPDSVLHKMHYLARTHWKSQGLQPQVVPLYQDSTYLSNSEGLVEWRGKRICMITDKRWSHRLAETSLSVDYLYLCRGFWGTIAPLQNIFQVGTVLLDASLSRHQVALLKSECDSLQLTCIDIAHSGAYKIPL
ncbi:MAG: ComEC/Rec2 family competence protein [Phocaeicola sp.]